MGNVENTESFPYCVRSRFGRSVAGPSLQLVMAIACLFITEPLYAQASFKPLGVFGGLRSEATDVSADGSVVVGFADSNVFRWTAMGNMLRPAVQQNGAAVSPDGTVVVGSHIVPGAGIQAFRWTAENSFETLTGFPGGPAVLSSAAFDASFDGSVVVGRATTAADDVAFRWTRATGMVGLGDLPGGQTNSLAFGVSADGNVVVGEGYGADNRPQAFRWTDAGMVGLGRLPGGVRSRARGVSSDGGTVVGINSYPEFPGPMDSRHEAFRWTETGGMMGLGDLPDGVLRNEALDVSADGSVVVGYAFTIRPNNSPGQEAFFWTEATGMVDLRDALIAGGVTGLENSILFEATGVSADGRTIVGTAFHDGVRQAFVATVPEPSTIVLSAMAVAGLVGFHFVKRRGVPVEEPGFACRAEPGA